MPDPVEKFESYCELMELYIDQFVEKEAVHLLLHNTLEKIFNSAEEAMQSEQWRGKLKGVTTCQN